MCPLKREQARCECKSRHLANIVKTYVTCGYLGLSIVKCYAKYLVTNYCALQNLTAGKVIIIHPYIYRLYWYLEAYNVTSAIAF